MFEKNVRVNNKTKSTEDKPCTEVDRTLHKVFARVQVNVHKSGEYRKCVGKY